MSLPTEPYSRIERYLAKLAVQDVDIPDRPITRIECYLAYLCDNGGGGGGGGFTPAPNAGAHNGIFRGQSLGTEYTADQAAAITGGSFDDMYVGDYWTLSDRIYRIAGFDLFIHTGDTEMTSHHAVIVPDSPMYQKAMNSNGTTAGGYQGSELKTTGLDDALTTISAAFGAAHVLERRTMLCNAVSGGVPSGRAWSSTKVDLMSESQVFGLTAWGTQNQNAFNIGERYSRFPLFELCPEYIVNRTSWYWLQDIRDATRFSNVTVDGITQSSTADTISGGVRPYFCIA